MMFRLTASLERAGPMADILDILQRSNRDPHATWAAVWHSWMVIIPRRSITGRLLWGKVWRRHDGRHWIYKKFIPDVNSDG